MVVIALIIIVITNVVIIVIILVAIIIGMLIVFKNILIYCDTNDASLRTPEGDSYPHQQQFLADRRGHTNSSKHGMECIDDSA